MRALPTTLEAIESIALQAPRRPAIFEGGATLDYGALDAAVQRCAAALHERGLGHRQRIAVAGPGFGLQLVVAIAAESLGAVTLSYAGEADPDRERIEGLVDFVASAAPQPPREGVRFVHCDEAFRRTLAPGAPFTPAPRVALDAHEPQRILRTSGSTGHSRFMVLQRQAQEYWLANCIRRDSFGESMRLWVGGPFIANSAYVRAMSCLRVGGCVMAAKGTDLPRLAPTHWIGLPLHLEQLLGELPEGVNAPGPVRMACVGAATPPALRGRALARLGGPLVNSYGLNEAGLVCDVIDDAGRGVVSRGVDIRILGTEGEDLPVGQPGVICVRTPSMADGYLDDPEATAAAFRDGWFVSSDIGVLLAPRVLQLGGRQDDLVNVAGVKVPAANVERELLAALPVNDCAVVATNLEGGKVGTGLALVLREGATQAECDALLPGVLARLLASGGARVVYLQALPRLPNGKADRLKLQRVLRARAA